MAHIWTTHALHSGTVFMVFMLLGIYNLQNIEVTLTTIVELYNEGDDIVNHHGFQRQVKNGKEVQAKAKYLVTNK